jgi:hypothetical protein
MKDDAIDALLSGPLPLVADNGFSQKVMRRVRARFLALAAVEVLLATGLLAGFLLLAPAGVGMMLWNILVALAQSPAVLLAAGAITLSWISTALWARG